MFPLELNPRSSPPPPPPTLLGLAGGVDDDDAGGVELGHLQLVTCKTGGRRRHRRNIAAAQI